MRSFELDQRNTACTASALDIVVRQHDESPNGRAKHVQTLLPRELPAALVGRLIGFNDAGAPLVRFSGSDNNDVVTARSTVAFKPDQIGSEVVLVLAGGNAAQPIIVGCIVPPQPAASQPLQPIEAELNGKRLELTAQDELVLRCGKSSVTLTKAGKVIIRGAYLLSRSSGVNRIKGGSVQIN
jgi:hypothetical protein